MRQPTNLLVWVLALALSACATTRYEEYGPPPEGGAEDVVEPDAGSGVTVETVPMPQYTLEERVARLETVVLTRLDNLESGDAELATRLAALSEQIVELKRELARHNAPAPQNTPAPSTPTVMPPKPPAQPAPRAGATGVNRIYEQALSDFDRQRYEVARNRFKEVLAAVPNGDLADNAHYWIGECYYAEGRFREALTSF